MRPAPARPGIAFAVLSFFLFSAASAAPSLAPAPADPAVRRPSPGPTTIRAAVADDRLTPSPPPGLTFGASWVDLDGDGDLDLTIPVDVDSTTTLRVWRNDGGTFHDITAELGLEGIPFARSAAWLDLDGDGDLDLYITRRSDADRNLLFENQGGHMVEVRGATGLEGPATDVSQAWADFDGDGDWDLYLPGVILPPRLLRNDGGFHFVDVTAASGLDTLSQSIAAAWGDLDGDGLPDLAIGEVERLRLYLNRGGHFVEITPDLGPRGGFIVIPSWGDVDGDGDLDLLVGGYFPPHLLENTFHEADDPVFAFVDRTSSWGSGAPRGSGGTWVDLDLDGDLDLLSEGGTVGTRVFENQIATGGGLVDITDAAGLPAVLGTTWHAAWGDFDGDGRVDFYAPHEVEPHLYRNESLVAGNALRLALAPKRGGVPIGARVRDDWDGHLQLREIAWPSSAFSFSSPQVVLAAFGRRVVPWVDVRWPSGEWERFHGLKAGPLETLVEGRGQKLPSGREPAGAATIASGVIPPRAAFSLSCNPCREELRIEAAARPSLSAGAAARISIFDALGRVVRRLGVASDSDFTWDLRDENGRRVRPGIYWVRMGGPTGESSLPPVRVVVLP